MPFGLRSPPDVMVRDDRILEGEIPGAIRNQGINSMLFISLGLVINDLHVGDDG